jgi:hypothetical protein
MCSKMKDLVELLRSEVKVLQLQCCVGRGAVLHYRGARDVTLQNM